MKTQDKKRKVTPPKSISAAKKKVKPVDVQLKDPKQIETQQQKKTAHLKIKSVPNLENDKVLGTRRVKRNITEQKLAEEVIKDNEKRFRELIESLPQLFWTCRVDGPCDYLSKQWVEFTGIPEVEQLGYGWLEQLHPDDKDRTVSEWMEKVKTGDSFNIEFRIRRADGIYHWFKTKALPMRDTNNNIIRWLGSNTDVDDLKRSLETLERFVSTIESSTDLISYADINANILYMNIAGKKILGLKTDDEITKYKIENFISDDSNDEMFNTVLPEIFRVGSWTGDSAFKDLTGKKIHVALSCALLKNKNGEPEFLTVNARDISERKQVEKALQESEERFRIAAETSNDVVYEWDLKQSVKWFGKIDEMLGYNPGEFPRTLDGLGASVHPEDWVRVMAAVQAHLEGRAPYAEEYRAIKKDGTFRWWSARGAVARTPDGKPVRWVGTVTDITERKFADEALYEAKENLELRILERTAELTRSKQLLDETGRLARVGGWELDLNKNKLIWSDVVKQIHEVEPEYQPTLEAGINFYAPEAIPVISEAMRFAIEEGQSFDVELQLITAKKNRIWVRAIGEAYRENDEITKIVGIFHDINNRKLPEIESRKKSEQLQLLSNELEIIIDSIPGLVFYKDTNNRFIRVNKYMCDAYKMSKKQLEGISLNDLHTKEQAQAYYEDDLQVIRSRQSKINIDEPWKTETGMRWVSTSKIPHMNEKGEVVGVIGVSMDVTERKLAEEELKKHREHLEILVAEKTVELTAAIENLERSNKELEQFAYVASHDLQEPLRMVSSYTQLLGKRYKDKLDEDANDFINFAVDGANRMQRLINDLLEYSRVTTRGKPFEKLDLSSILGQVIATLQHKIQDTNAMVSNEDLPFVVGDEIQLSRVFQNLIDNALKFRRDEPPRIHISSKFEGDKIIISISDNGIGINEKFKDRVFTIFQRLHNREDYPGTGIGLAICKRIIERHGGKIWFESEEGKGTTFYFTLNK